MFMFFVGIIFQKLAGWVCRCCKCCCCPDRPGGDTAEGDGQAGDAYADKRSGFDKFLDCYEKWQQATSCFGRSLLFWIWVISILLVFYTRLFLPQ